MSRTASTLPMLSGDDRQDREGQEHTRHDEKRDRSIPELVESELGPRRIGHDLDAVFQPHATGAPTSASTSPDRDALVSPL